MLTLKLIARRESYWTARWNFESRLDEFCRVEMHRAEFQEV